MYDYAMDYDGDGDVGVDDMCIWEMYEDAERIRMERDDELAIGSPGSGSGGSAYRRSSDSKYILQAEIDMEKWRRGVDERMRIAGERGEMEDRIKAMIPLVIILISFIISLFNGH